MESNFFYDKICKNLFKIAQRVKEPVPVTLVSL